MSATVSGSWTESLDNLQSFIQSNPRLEVADNSLCIPEDLRLEFFRLFDTVRLGFIESECQSVIEHAHVLGAKYADSETELTLKLGLEGIVLPPDLEGFLHNPVKALASLVSNPLYEFIRHGKDRDSMRRQVLDSIQTSYHALYFSGYVRWVMLSLASIGTPNQLFKVSIGPLMDQDAVYHDSHEERSVPDPVLTKCLILGDETFVTFLVPDIIIDIPGTTQFLSLKAQAGKPTSVAKQKSHEREWLSHGSKLEFKSCLLAYVDSSVKDLSLVADARQVCRPDLLIQFWDRGLAKTFDMSQASTLNNALNPVLGSYVLLLNSMPTTELGPKASVEANKPSEYKSNQIDGIQVFEIGFERSALETVWKQLVCKIEKST